MGKDQRKIGIEVDIQTTLSGMDKVVSEMQKKLKEGSTQVDMTKGIGKSLQKQIENFQELSKRFGQLTKDNQIDFGDAKEVQKTGAEMLKIFKTLQDTIGDFNNLTVLDAKKLFPQAFKQEVDNARARLETIKSSLEKLDDMQLKITAQSGSIDETKNKIEEIKTKIEERKTLNVNFNNAQSALNTANQAVDELREKLRESIKLKIETSEEDIKKLTEKQTAATGVRQSLGVREGEFTGGKNNLAFRGKQEATWLKQADSEEKTLALQALEARKQELEITEQLTAKTEELNQLRKAQGEENLVKAAISSKASVDEVDAITSALQRQKQATADNTRAQQELRAHEKAHGDVAGQFERTTATLEKQETELTRLRGEYDKLDKEIDANGLIKLLKELGVEKISGLDITPELLKNEEGLKKMLSSLSAMDKARLDILKSSLKSVGFSSEETARIIEAMNKALEQTGNSAKAISDADKEIEQLTNNLKSFFSISNSIQLFKRAITSAMNTVKELDATMTEAAVVTDFSVGDMWNKLPTYADEAQKLGVSINGLYGATTLYYQQGLKTNEAMALGIETMKMARIAGMESAEATEAMTAALRGFNMELNETSATQVNDVYSKLAAVTAADTNQIATAMSKTASIAASANMEFETTAALLAQIIETTQEAPETAGTALKTIIARFSEVKSLQNKGEGSGKDTEGEDIDVNKIQTALRSVGISMNDFFAGTEGLDSVLMKLSEKWDELDFTTQRYIATTAAGSRQQSRFIAMMSDYARTTELVSAAQNSAGASQMQFNKTLDSMDAKLQQLENTWNEFLMGLANNEILKAGVDILTNLLSAINSFINTISLGSDKFKSIVSLFLTISTLKIGKTLFNGVFDGLREIRGKISKEGTIPDQAMGKDPEGKGRSGGKKTGEGFLASLGTTLKNGTGKIKNVISDMLKPNGDPDFYDEDLNEGADGGQVPPQSTQPPQGQETSINSNSEALKKNTKEVKENGQAWTYIKNNSAALSTGFLSVGAACGILSGKLEEMGNVTGSKVAAGFGAVLTGLGTILPLLTQLPTILSTISAGFVALNAALGPIGWVAIGLIGAIVAIWAVVSSGSEAVKDLEKDIENLTAQTQSFQNQANEANQAIISLTEALDKLGEKDPFEDLIVGSKEWRQALIENNEYILGLIEQYPALKNFLEVGEGGRLKIGTNDEGVSGYQVVIDQYTQATVDAFTASETATQEAQEKKNEITLRKTLFGNVGYTSVEEETGLSVDEFNTLLKEVTARGYFNEENEGARLTIIQETADELFGKEKVAGAGAFEINSFLGGQLPQEQFQQAYSDWLKYLASVESQEFDEQNSNNLVLNNIVSNSLEPGENVEVIQGLMTRVFAGYGDQIDAQTDKYVDSWDTKTDWGTTVGEDLKKTYQDLTGKTMEEINKLSKEEISRYIASYNKGQEVKIKTEKMADAYEKLPDELKAYFVEGGKGLAQEDLKKDITRIFGDYEGLLRTLGYSRQEFYDLVRQRRGEASEIFGEGVDDSSLTAGSYESRKDKKVLYGSDTESGEGAVWEMYKALQWSTPEMLAAIYDTDWSNLEEVKALEELMLSLGKNIPEDELDALINKIIEVGKATQHFTVEEAAKYSTELNKIISDINYDKQDKKFSKDQYEAMIAADHTLANSFVQMADGSYLLVGKSMDELAKALNTNTDALVASTVNELTGKSKVAKELGDVSWDQLMANFTGADTRGATNFESSMIALLGDSTTKGSLTADERAALGIGNLTYEDFNQLSPTEQRALAQQFRNIILEGTEFSYTEQAKQLTGDYENQQNWTWKDMYDVLYSKGSFGTHTEGFGGLGGDVGSQTPATVGVTYWDETQQKDMRLFAEQIGLAQHHLDAYDDYLEKYKSGVEMTEEEILAGQSALANAINRQVQTKKLEGTIKNLQAIREEYGELAEDSQEYEEAVATYTAAFKGAVNSEFVDTYFQKIQEAANGNVEAMQEVFDLMNQENHITVTADGDFSGLVARGEAAFETVGQQQEAYLNYLNNLGNIEIVRYTVTTEASYPVMTANGIEIQKVPANTTIDLVRPVGANRLQTVMGGSGGKSKSSGGSAPKKWENPYDEFYNSVEKINESLRMREKLEQRYQRLVNRNAANAAELANIQRDQLSLLEAERKEREYILRGRERQMSDIINEYSDVGNYAQWNEEKMRIEIDWNSLEQLDGSTDEKLTGRVEEFISKLEEQQKLIEEEIDSIESIEDATWEIYSSGKDEYLDLESQIKEALVNSRQREIDELSEINNSINDANSAILDSMQKQIDQERQLRDNQKTEEEIANKENRLAYLRQDTSGANALEIMKLEKEINDQKQDYTDTLIDQKISDLQEQNDLAAEQREQQIEIMQSQLDWYEKSQQVWNDVHTLMQTGLDLENNLIKGSDLETILKGENGFESMSQIEQMNWLNELESLVANGLKWLSNGAMQSLYGVGAEVSFVNADGQLITGKINSSGDVEAEGQIYSGKNFFMSTSGDLTTTQTRKEASEAYKETVTEPTPEPPAEPEEPSKTGWYFSKTGKRYWSRADAEKAVNSWFNEEKVKLELMAAKNKTAVSLAEVGALEQTRDRALASIRIHQFKTGGLADFTGPAWLDGTKSRPEYILNADQTKAFFSLVDVLSSLQSGSSKTTQNSGDNTYDIDINVESIGSDYDVERLADTVKRLINEDARYRNNNAINLMR